MRPENQRIKSQRAAVSRGKMYLKANLGWLSGFPVSRGSEYVDWVSVPKTGEIVVNTIKLTGEHLHDATYTYNKLVNNFPRALSGIVENKDIWIDRVPKLFDLLKNSIHQNEDYPESLSMVKNVFPSKTVKKNNELCRKAKDLEIVINSFSWLAFIYPDEFSKALDWLDLNQKVVKNIVNNAKDYDGIVTTILLYRIHQSDGKSKVNVLTACLGNESIFDVLTHGSGLTDKYIAFLSQVKKGVKNIKIPEKPKPDFGLNLVQFIWWLSGQDQSTRRRALTLFPILIPDNFVENWNQWWKKIQPLIIKTHGIASGRNPDLVKKSAMEMRSELKKLKENIPASLSPDRFISIIKKISESNNIALYKKSLPVFKKLPVIENNCLVRVAFLQKFIELRKYYPNGTALLGPFKTYLSKYSNQEGFLRPWLVNSKITGDVFEEILYEAKDQKIWPLIFNSLAQIISYSDKFNFDDFDLLVSLVKVTKDSSVATSYMKQFIVVDKQGGYFSEDQLRCIYLMDKNNNKAGSIVEKMEKLDLEEKNYTKLISIIEELEKAGWEDLALKSFEDGNLKVLNTLGIRYFLLKKLKIETCPVKNPAEYIRPQWSKNYPEELIPELSVLDYVSSEAEKKAYKILSGNFPSREKTLKEIEVIKKLIEKKPENNTLNERLINLCNRLDGNPNKISDQQIGKLRGKLERAVRTSVIQGWLENVSEQLAREYDKSLDLKTFKEFFDDNVNTEIIGSILNLPKSFRDIGIKLIKRGLTNSDVNLSEHVENKNYIKQINQKGIKTEHWLNPPSPYQKEGKDGQFVTISFETDPIEILKMGHYFKTCLSPGSFNFFSAVSNAADINKHVVYARDKNEKVIGRCLFALTNEGMILTFNPYCHDNSIKFDEMMGELAERLAEKMNTIVASDREVPSLVSNKWYDDGSINLCNRYSFLHYDSEFRNSLSNIKIEDFIPELEKLFSPLPLNELTLPLVVEFNEIQDRPELILPLLPAISSCDTLSDIMKIKSAKLAFLAGEKSYSIHLLKKRAEKYLLSEGKNLWRLDYQLLEILGEINPSAALRVLRKTREKDVKKDENETDSERKRLLSMVYEQLGRKYNSL
ncbi:MAG: hypothetical protein GY760_14890 [Deltaproteobacteria bacterium]|nr:hypothetical protein [Deltaproteobacteria bacterium]